ncbi:MAG TPA: hypothetical protein VFL93_15125 [Longimicrobiaceae bacterium]|nr:hypothetical protein [Longimicrobiaceae bacterium]
MTPFVVGIVGDSGSGKNTVADAVQALLGPERVTDLRLDDYLRLTRAERAERGVTALNPVVHNMPLMAEHLELLRQGRPIRNRSYDHSDGTFGPIRAIEPREIILVRGLLGFPTEELRVLYDLAVFLHPEPELLFRWKLRRDVLSRGYTEAEVLKRIAQYVLDAKEFIIPQVGRADLVVREELPDPDAPDAAVRTSLLFRGAARGPAQRDELVPGLAAASREEQGGETVVRLAADLDPAAVDAWGEALFPEHYDTRRIGTYLGEGGERARRPQLALVEVVVARLALLLRDREHGSDKEAR